MRVEHVVSFFRSNTGSNLMSSDKENDSEHFFRITLYTALLES